MDYSIQKEDNLGIFSLSGNLIGENDGMPLAEDFNEAMEEGIINFILDLSELKHINSTGLGVFITLLTGVRKKDGELVLVNPSEYIHNLMVITKLNTIFTVFPTLADAKASFSK